MIKRQNKGFTLIEVMIVVAIIAIIAAIAYPSYQEYVKRTKRVEVQAYLMEVSHRIASFKLANQGYDGLTIAKVGSSTFPASGAQTYSIRIEEFKDSKGKIRSIILLAQPSITSSQKGTGALSLSSTGEQCWYKNNDSPNLQAKKDENGNDVPVTACTYKWSDK